MRSIAKYAFVVAVLVAPIAAAVASTTTTTEASDETAFVNWINAKRKAYGKAPLKVSTHMRSIARKWSDHMLSANLLSHNPNLGYQIDTTVTTHWTAYGENVGEGGTVSALESAFWNSSEHRANILGGYNYVGVGVQISSNGTIWVTMDFIKSTVTLY